MAAPTIEDRVRKLEGFRYRVLGQLNATRTVLFGAWHVLLDQHFQSPDDAIRELRAAWLESAKAPSRDFPGTDPAELDMISAEYEKAIDELTAELLRIARGIAKG